MTSDLKTFPDGLKLLLGDLCLSSDRVRRLFSTERIRNASQHEDVELDSSPTFLLLALRLIQIRVSSNDRQTIDTGRQHGQRRARGPCNHSTRRVQHLAAASAARGPRKTDIVSAAATATTNGGQAPLVDVASRAALVAGRVRIIIGGDNLTRRSQLSTERYRRGNKNIFIKIVFTGRRL